MKIDDAVNKIYAKYAKYGVTEETIRNILMDGIENYDLSILTAYNGLRLIIALETGEQESFSVEDAMDMTGASREEILKNIAECEQEIITERGNPEYYFQMPKQPFIFMNTLRG